jgi:hypothetical protein
MAQAAMRQSTDDRTVTPFLRAARKSWIASWKSSPVNGSSIARRSVQDIARVLEGVAVIEPLQDFLNDRQASDDLCHIDQILDAERRPQAQGRDPHARIDQNHGSLASSPLK